MKSAKIETNNAQLIDVNHQETITSIFTSESERNKSSHNLLQALELSNINQAGKYYLRYGKINYLPVPMGQIALIVMLTENYKYTSL